MDKNNFLQFVGKYLEAEQLDLFSPVIFEAQKDILEATFIAFSCEKFKNFESLLRCFEEVLNGKCKNLAKKTKIKNFKGGVLQEQNILTLYFLKKEMTNYPEWFKNRIL